jgi:putative sigma-54 modulation protein
MRLEEIMTSRVVTIGPDEPASTAWSRMERERIRHLVVVESGRIVAVLSERDVGGQGGAGVRRGRFVHELMLKKSANNADKRGKEPPAAGGAGIGRGRVRVPDSARREPMAASVPRPLKTSSGRAVAAQTPAFIRGVGTALDAADREYLRRKLGRRLGKFAPSIERVSVRIEDVNGPRGGIDKRCRIKIVLSQLPSVMVEEQHPDLQAAMDRALARSARVVRRTLERRRAQAVGTRRGV